MLRVRLTGGVAAEVDGQPVIESPSRRAWALLAWLALHPGMHSRAEVAARLWPDVVDASARQSMRSAIWSLRQCLDPYDPDALITSRDRIGLRADTVVDVHEFRELVARDRLEDAVRIGDATLLAAVDDEWALLARDEHRQQLIDVLGRLAARAEPARAVEWARRAVALDPLSEEATRELMQRLADAGDRPAALAEYRTFVERLRRELRLSPSQETWRLAERIRTAVPATPTVHTRPGVFPLIGRSDELRRLRAAWTASQAGHGGLAVVRGEPGFGKTRLVTQLADLAVADATVATGAAPDLAGPPLTPWTEVAGALMRSLDRVPRAPWVAALAPLLPAHVDVHPDTVPPDLQQARLAEAVVALIEAASARRPVLVVLEDLHAADDATLTMLAHVVRRIADLPVLLVLTRRERPSRDQLAALEHATRQRGTLGADVVLRPLDDAAIAELARAVATLPADAVAQVVAAADGNPLLAVESARALAAGEELPAGLRGTVRAATARLAPAARELVRTLAVAGRDLSAAEACEWAGGVPAEALPPVEEQGLIEFLGDRMRFRHALLRDAVYADLSGADRAERHLRTAERLADAPDRVAERAAHLRAAGRLAEAGTVLMAAAAQARAVGALTDATQLLDDACAARPADPEAALALADVLAWRGRPADSRVAYEKAVALLERAGDAEALATAHLRFAEWHYGPICQPDVAVAACRRALAVLDGAGVDRPDLRAEILSVHAWCESIGGDVVAAEQALERLRGFVGDDYGPPIVACAAYRTECFVLLRQGRFAEGVAPGLRAADAAIRAGRPDLVYSGLVNAAFGAAAAGDLDRALQLLDRTAAALRGHGMLAIDTFVLIDRAWVLTRLGRDADAIQATALARACADRLAAPHLQALADAERGRVALRAGDYAAAAELLRTALAAGEAGIARPLARLQLAEALARLGRPDDAEAELAELVFEPVHAGDWPDTLVSRMSAVEGLVAAARGDVPLARQRLEAAATGWRRWVSPAELGRQLEAVMVDLGRPIIGLVVAAEELAAIEADLEALRTRAGA